ncbi:hypothetical protein NLI96_g12749 [Meripilus lineatus]|uniref:Uncharacterized protein n=1 Tax=Meripilus lineatus TaxID=2056292 RepID=A0AAD5UPD0_9APHY|nr:hypothetical protein NLI96_g12749 [Physisporinus lineatus]
MLLPLPTPTAYPHHSRRPSTASSRPGTAPASFYSTNGFASGPLSALGSYQRPELSLSFLAGHGRGSTAIGSDSIPRSYAAPDPGQDDPMSPAGAQYDSPFSFHAPSTTTTHSSFTDHRSPAFTNPRKRPHSGSDDDDDFSRTRGDTGRPISSSGPRPGTSGGPFAYVNSGPGNDYDYGSESRPQSRRLSVMELCNDTDADPTNRPFIPLSRPTTSSGLVTSASQLALSDRPTPPPPALVPSPLGSNAILSPDTPERIRTSPAIFTRVASSSAGANQASPGGRAPAPVSGSSEFGRGLPSPVLPTRLSTSAAARQQSPSSPSSAGTPSPLLSSAIRKRVSSTASPPAERYRRASGGVVSPASDAGSQGSLSGRRISRGDSNGSDDGSGGGESQRGSNAQVRIPTAVGMRA